MKAKRRRQAPMCTCRLHHQLLQETIVYVWISKQIHQHRPIALPNTQTDTLFEKHDTYHCRTHSGSRLYDIRLDECQRSIEAHYYSQCIIIPWLLIPEAISIQQAVTISAASYRSLVVSPRRRAMDERRMMSQGCRRWYICRSWQVTLLIELLFAATAVTDDVDARSAIDNTQRPPIRYQQCIFSDEFFQTHTYTYCW